MKGKTPGAGAFLFILFVLTFVCLLPFAGRAVHMDDALFVWCAQQIQAHPADFYGFKVNWEGTPMPMSIITQNPPLASYFMAMAGATLGWHETVLHVWFFVPAFALIAGVWRLARNFSGDPLVAGLIAVTAPVFLLSSTSLMCDTLMLALWTWAVVFWMEGLTSSRAIFLGAAAVLISAALLTKYFAISLIPLLAMYTVMVKRRVDKSLAWLLIPVATICLYQEVTRELYGRGMVFSAVDYASKLRVGGGLLERALAEFSFSGGCMVVLLPLIPVLWGRRGWVAMLSGVATIGLIFIAVKKINGFSMVDADGVHWGSVAQLAWAVVAGAVAPALAVADWRKHKTPDSMLLALWIGGTFFFGFAVNWTVSGRNILPMLPAIAILIARRCKSRGFSFGRLIVPLALSLTVGLWVTWGDYLLAQAPRDAAAFMREKIPSTSAVFEGHWGFQYYMEQLGFKALDLRHGSLNRGQIVIIPTLNCYLMPVSEDEFDLVDTYRGRALPGLTTMGAGGAGYYSDAWGPLPFAFGPAGTGEYRIYRAR